MVNKEVIIKELEKSLKSLDMHVYHQVPITEEALKTVIETLKESRQKTGVWVQITEGETPEIYMCSVCGRYVVHAGVKQLVAIRYPYCHCGAKMEYGEVKNDDKS